MKNVIKVKEFTVYKHTNLINGKVYIGITSQNVKARWNNGWGYQNNKYFWRAIQKYKWENFKHEILFEHLSFKIACEKEIELIKYYNSNNSKFGYNISSGGECNSLGKKMLDETKKKISLSKIGTLSWNKGRAWSQETKEKMQQAKLGRKVLEKTKKKMSQIMLNNANSKKIICIETGEIFPSISEAGRILNISFSNIASVCRKQRKTAKNLHFEYYIGD